MRIYIDGQDLVKCFTTWENFYRSSNQGAQILNSLEFRSSVRRLPALAGNGYLFDNVSTLPLTARVHQGATCRLRRRRQSDGDRRWPRGLPDHGPQPRPSRRPQPRACDRIPRQMTFVSADRRLRRIGRQRCLRSRACSPANASASTSCSRSMPTRRRAE